MFHWMSWFKKQGDSSYGKGWLIDKPDDRNYQATEIFKSPVPVTWIEKPQTSWKRILPIRTQDGSSACVAFTVSTLLANENKIEEGKYLPLSPRMIYARGVVPGGGMFYKDAMKIGQDVGACLEVLLPSDGKGEVDMLKLDDEKKSDLLVARVYRGGPFVFLPVDIDWIAGMVSTGKAVALGTRFNSGDFSTGEVKLAQSGIYGHAVSAVDFTMWKGEKAIVFQNSWSDKWGFGGLGVITETQLKTGGLVTALYFENLPNVAESGTMPKINIVATSLSIGASNGEVGKLQIMLQFLGFFPSGTECTGYYGGITRQGVKDFQTKEGLPADGIANQPTITKLNGRFA
jgi:hypothetical protein